MKMIVVGVALMVLAPVVLVTGLLLAWRPVTGDADYVPADGAEHRIDVEPDEKYGVYARDDEPVSCRVFDEPSGEQVALSRISGELTINGWTARERFDSGDGSVVLVCQPANDADAEARIGPLPSVPLTVGLTLGSIFGAILLGLVGLVLLVVGIVRRSAARRQPR